MSQLGRDRHRGASIGLDVSILILVNEPAGGRAGQGGLLRPLPRVSILILVNEPAGVATQDGVVAVYELSQFLFW